METKTAAPTRRDFLQTAAGVAASLAALDVADAATAPVRNILIRTRQRFQTMEHFGASGAWSLDPIGAHWSEENKNRIADLLFSRDKGIGLSCFRFNIGAGDPNPKGYSHPWRRPEGFRAAADAPYYWTRQAGQQWFLQAAKARGVETMLACVYSPPVWLTKNGRAFGEADGACNLKPGGEKEFGRYLADILRHFRSQGTPFDYLSPINEPNWAWHGGQEGCTYNVEDIKRVTRAIARELRADGSPTQLHLVEAGDLRCLLSDADYRAYNRVSRPDIHLSSGLKTPGKYREYADELLGDPAIGPLIAGKIGGHSYWTYSDFHDLYTLRTQLRECLDRIKPDAPFWQTEVCIMEHGRDLGMDTALRVAEILHYDLTAAGASVWHWWLAVSQGNYKDGLIYTDYDAQANPERDSQNVLPSKTLWALGNYSRFIRPGMKRVAADTDALPDDLLVSAYMHESGQLVLVVTNPTTSPIPIRLRCDHAVDRFTPYVTSEAHSLEAMPALPGPDYTAPARSIVTLVAPLLARTARKSPVPIVTGGAPLRPAQRETAAPDLYHILCGDTSKAPEGSGGRRNSRSDMAYGRDPGTGFSWGYSSYGPTGARGKTDALPGVRWEDGDTPGQGLVYRFETPPGKRLNIELSFYDPWNNPGRAMDILLNGARVESDLVAGQTPVTKRYTVTPQNGSLEIAVRRAAKATEPTQDPLLSSIRVW